MENANKKLLNYLALVEVVGVGDAANPVEDDSADGHRISTHKPQRDLEVLAVAGRIIAAGEDHGPARKP